MIAQFQPQLFSELPIVGILRGFSLAQTIEIVEAGIRGGLKNIEITMNSADAANQIREIAKLAAGRINVGAGTVTSPALLDQALAAGASFIVTPTVGIAVIKACVRASIPVFPGAFSPSEIAHAWDLGASMVKVFPADNLGPGFIRSIKAPLPHIKLMPTGGVDLKTVRDWVSAGADGFGVGSPLFQRSRVEAGDWAWVETQCRAFATMLKEARPHS